MFEALALGAIAQSSLFLSGLLVYWIHVPRKIVGILAGYGAGALVSAIEFDLVPEAVELGSGQIAVWMLVGAAIFLGGDAVVDKQFGEEGAGGAMGIVVGSVVDGVPESIIFGIQIAAGDPVSAGFLAAVLISNVPQAIAPSADLATSGWPLGRTARLWLAVVAACAIAAAVGWAMANGFSGTTGDRAAAIAAGGLLAMLTNSLMPFAFERGGVLAGVATVLGFCLTMPAT